MRAHASAAALRFINTTINNTPVAVAGIYCDLDGGGSVAICIKYLGRFGGLRGAARVVAAVAAVRPPFYYFCIRYV